MEGGGAGRRGRNSEAMGPSEGSISGNRRQNLLGDRAPSVSKRVVEGLTVRLMAVKWSHGGAGSRSDQIT